MVKLLKIFSFTISLIASNAYAQCDTIFPVYNDTILVIFETPRLCKSAIKFGSYSPTLWVDSSRVLILSRRAGVNFRKFNTKYYSVCQKHFIFVNAINGRTLAEGIINAESFFGELTIYRNSGQIKETRYYDFNGIPCGKWYKYTRNGKLKKFKNYSKCCFNAY
jgi:hypothetical protein